MEVFTVMWSFICRLWGKLMYLKCLKKWNGDIVNGLSRLQCLLLADAQSQREENKDEL